MKVKPRRLAEQEFTYFRGQNDIDYFDKLLTEAKAEAETKAGEDDYASALGKVIEIESQITALREDKVTFTIIPLSNGLQTHIAALGRARAEEFGVDIASVHMDVIGYALKSVTGLEDIDAEGNLISFALEFENKKIGKKSIKRVTDECLDRLPGDVFGEILEKVNMSGGITVEEHKQINFTPACSEPISSSAISAGQEHTETPLSAPTSDITQ